MLSTDNDPRFLFFSNLLGRPIVGHGGATIGRLADLVVVTGEPYPLIESLVIDTHGQRFQLPWSSVAGLNGKVQLGADAQLVPLPATPAPYRMRLAEEILDRQIVDIEDAKLVRVNDLHFLSVKGALRLAHVDVGFRGLVRRLGWERVIDSAISLVRPAAPYLRADHFVSWKLVRPIESSPGRLRIDVAQRSLSSLHPADLAEIMEDLDRHQRAALFKSLDVETAADALEEASPQVATELLEAVSPEQAADILEEMAPDEAADALAELSGETRRELLDAMEKPEAHEVEELLEYRPQSAGGLMTPDLVVLGPDSTVAHAFAAVRRLAEELPIIFEVFVADPGGALKGFCTLKDLIVSEPETTLVKIMRELPVTVMPDAPAREVAEAASKYNLVSVPVVNPAGALVGMVTVDDILAEVLDAR